MKNKFRRFISLAAAIILTLNLAACSTQPTLNVFDDGANRFSDGKDEDTYYLKNSGQLLDYLIDEFSGSYEPPVAVPMSDDEYDDARKKADGSSDETTAPSGSDTGTTAPSGSGDSSSVMQVANYEELKRAFMQAYSATSEYLEFNAVNGYTVDLSVALQDVFNDLQREDPINVSSVKQWSWYTSGSTYFVEISYKIDIDELIRIKQATPALVDEAVSKIDTAGKSDFELIVAVNEYLCDTVYYPETEPYAPITHTAYGAFANGVAVCEGYACAAKLMLNKLGISCDIQVGTCTNGGGHAWNLVYLEGEWYQLDITWNDQSTSRNDYLLVTDDYMRRSRTWDTSDYPACAKKAYPV